MLIKFCLAQWMTFTVYSLQGDCILKSFLESYPDASYLFTEQEDYWKDTPKGSKLMKVSDHLKNKYRSNRTKVVWSKEEFADLSDGSGADVGTHSKRKIPSTMPKIVVQHGRRWRFVVVGRDRAEARSYR
jgi:hypothetical protein